MKQVFISYTRRSDYDKQFAEYLRHQLIAWGHRPWMDVYDIPKGAHWDDTIDAALKASDVVLGLVSATSVESDNVKNEWAWALQKGKLQLLLLQHCDIPHRFVRIDYLDFTNPQLQQAMWAKLHDLLAYPTAETQTNTSRLNLGAGIGQAVKRITGSFRAAPAPARPAQPGQRRSQGHGAALLILGAIAGVGLLAALVLSVVLNSINGGGGANNLFSGSGVNPVANVQEFIVLALSGDAGGAAQRVCPAWRLILQNELTQMSFLLAQYGGVRVSGMTCHEAGSNAVRCEYVVTANFSGLSEPVTVTVPTQDGLVCTSSLMFLGVQ